MANSAQLAAAQALQKGGQIFLATDASPRDPQVAPTLLSVAQAKNINVSVILTGNCTSDSSLRAIKVSDPTDGTREAFARIVRRAPLHPPARHASTKAEALEGVGEREVEGNCGREGGRSNANL